MPRLQALLSLPGPGGNSHPGRGFRHGEQTQLKTTRNPDDADSWLALGRALLRLGRVHDGARALARAAEKAAGGDVATTRRDALLLLKQAESLAAEYEVDVGLQIGVRGLSIDAGEAPGVVTEDFDCSVLLARAIVDANAPASSDLAGATRRRPWRRDEGRLEGIVNQDPDWPSSSCSTSLSEDAGVCRRRMSGDVMLSVQNDPRITGSVLEKLRASASHSQLCGSTGPRARASLPLPSRARYRQSSATQGSGLAVADQAVAPGVVGGNQEGRDAALARQGTGGGTRVASMPGMRSSTEDEDGTRGGGEPGRVVWDTNRQAVWAFGEVVEGGTALGFRKQSAEVQGREAAAAAVAWGTGKAEGAVGTGGGQRVEAESGSESGVDASDEGSWDEVVEGTEGFPSDLSRKLRLMCSAMREAFGSSSSRSHPRAEGTLASSASHNPARHGHSKSNGHPSSQPHPHHLRHHALHPRAQHHPPMHVTPTRHQGFWETRHQGSHAHAPDPLGSHRSTATFHAAVSTPPNTPAPSVTSPAGMRRGTASWGCATPAANTPHSLSTVAPSAAGAALPTPERAGGVPGCPESVPRSSLGHSSPISSLSPQPVARLPRVASNLTRELRRVESSGAVAVGTARNAGKSSSAKEALPEPGEGRSGRGQSEAALSALGRHGSCDARLGPGAVAAGLEEVGVGTAGSSEVAVGTVGREGAGVQPPELNGAGPACEGGDPRRPTRRGSSAKEGRHNADTGVPGTPSTPGLGRLRAGSARLGAWPSTDLGSLGSAPTSRPSPWGPGLTTSVSRTTSSVPRSADHKDPFLLEELFTPAATTPGANAVALGSEDFLCLRTRSSRRTSVVRPPNTARRSSGTPRRGSVGDRPVTRPVTQQVDYRLSGLYGDGADVAFRGGIDCGDVSVPEAGPNGGKGGAPWAQAGAAAQGTGARPPRSERRSSADAAPFPPPPLKCFRLLPAPVALASSTPSPALAPPSPAAPAGPETSATELCGVTVAGDDASTARLSLSVVGAGHPSQATPSPTSPPASRGAVHAELPAAVPAHLAAPTQADGAPKGINEGPDHRCPRSRRQSWLTADVAERLERDAEEDANFLRPYLQCKGLRVLESGAGTGVVGLTCAVMGATVVLAEADTDARRVVAANLEKNRALITKAGGSAVVAAADWADPSSWALAAAPSVDLVLVSGLVARDGDVMPLGRALDAVLAAAPDADLIVAHKHCSPALDAAMMSVLRAHNIRLRLLSSHACHSAVDEAPGNPGVAGPQGGDQAPPSSTLSAPGGVAPLVPPGERFGDDCPTLEGPAGLWTGALSPGRCGADDPAWGRELSRVLSHATIGYGLAAQWGGAPGDSVRSSVADPMGACTVASARASRAREEAGAASAGGSANGPPGACATALALTRGSGASTPAVPESVSLFHCRRQTRGMQAATVIADGYLTHCSDWSFY